MLLLSYRLQLGPESIGKIQILFFSLNIQQFAVGTGSYSSQD